MIYYRTEYRIVKTKNKCECYRSECAGAIGDKLDRLLADHPSTGYTVQSREARQDERGNTIRDFKGRPAWGPWQDRHSVN